MVKLIIWMAILPLLLLVSGSSGMMAIGIFWIEIFFVSAYKMAFID